MSIPGHRTRMHHAWVSILLFVAPSQVLLPFILYYDEEVGRLATDARCMGNRMAIQLR